MVLEMETILTSNKPSKEKLNEAIAFLDNIINPKGEKGGETKDYIIHNLSIHDFEPIPPFAD